MLRYKEDWKALLFMGITAGLLVINWLQPEFSWFTFLWACLMAVSITTIVHNHNHLRIFKNKQLNVLTDYFLTVFYGFPVFAWIPTHNKNHHKFNNKEGDYTITYRVSEKNNIFTMLSYPTISSFYQQKPIKDYLAKMWAKRKWTFAHCIMQYVILAAWIVGFLVLDWKKGLLFVVIPQQVGLFAVLMFNYLQHVETDELSEYNHSRNMNSPVMNALLFNNGFHTVHHDHPGLHWSKGPEKHAEIRDKIDPYLEERSFWWMVIRMYLLAPFFPGLRGRNLRLERMAREQAAADGAEQLDGDSLVAAA